MCSGDIFLGLLAILFPPLAVWVKCGVCSVDSLINLLLCVLGYVPGLLHAWYIIAKFPEPAYEYEPLHPDAEGGAGRVTYVIIHEDGRRSQRQAGPQQHGGMTYGTAAAASKSAAGAAPSARPPPAAHDAGEGSSDGAPPPSYAQVVAGDHKVQTQD